ncbi:MAG: DUF2157 domain-containing protein [Polyangiaceae bacterium]
MSRVAANETSVQARRMQLEGRIRRWVQAGLLEENQAARILAYEQQGERPWLLYAFLALGTLAVFIGLLAVVASNWDRIPGAVKLCSALLAIASCEASLLYLRARGSTRTHEVLLAITYGLVLGTIALVGQVYQLGGETREALLAWSLLTFPLMTLGHSHYLAILWTVGLQCTFGAWSIWLGDSSRHVGLGLALASVVPWLWLLLGSVPRIERARPRYAAMFRAIGVAEIALTATIGSHAYYTRTAEEHWTELWIGFAFATVIAIALGWRWSKHPKAAVLWGWLAMSLLVTFIPALTSTGTPTFLAALSFIALWLANAVTAHRLGALGLLNVATGIIGIRIVIVYFEVFGSLLDTGIGLIGGGALTLLLVWLWWRKRREFATQMREEGSSS